MKIEIHKRNLKESLSVIDECVQKGFFKERQRTIGFNCSTAAVDILEILLHKHNLIDPGTQIKHNWFSSERKAREKLNFDFPYKNKILPLIVSIENNRNLLCYGKPQPEKIIEDVILQLNKLREILKKEGVE